MYLLDTHVLLWYFMGSEKLGSRAKNEIEKNLCFYSTATLWELGIKQSINKIDLKLKLSELENTFIKSAFLKLEINAKQIDRLKNLAVQDGINNALVDSIERCDNKVTLKDLNSNRKITYQGDSISSDVKVGVII